MGKRSDSIHIYYLFIISLSAHTAMTTFDMCVGYYFHRGSKILDINKPSKEGVILAHGWRVNPPW